MHLHRLCLAPILALVALLAVPVASGEPAGSVRVERDALFGVPAAGHIGDYLGMTMDRFGNSYPAWTGVRPDKLDSDIFMTVVGAHR
jgi:hypothetical protein